MQKLSQRELLDEGFLDIVRGVGKSIGRGALATTKGVIKTISPTGAKILGSAADAVGAAVANIIGSSPSVALDAFLKRPENRNLFKTYKIIKETNLPNGDRSIQLTGEFINPQTYAVSDITTNIIFRRIDGGGIEPEKWKCISKLDPQTGQFYTNQKNQATPTPSQATATPRQSTQSAGNTTSTSTGFSQSPSTITSSGGTTTI